MISLQKDPRALAIDQPNLVYILADDMGYGDLSCLNGQSRIQTPHLDRLAARGMIFRDAHASSAVCTPSRYSLLTGRYNWRSWLKKHVTEGYSPPVIEPGRMTVASFLKQHGYATACIGKWHLGWNWPMRSDRPDEVDFAGRITNGPVSVGFDCFFGISASLDMPPYVYVANERPTARPDRIIPANEGKTFWRAGPIAPDFQHDEVLPKLTQRAVQSIDERTREGRPFFLYFSLPAPHTPILPTPAFLGKSKTNAYGDFCLQVDDVVGQVMAALERNGVADNTILIFASDNGCSPMAGFPELTRCGHNPSYVFRGHKADIYEGGHRIPLIIRWPRRLAAGAVCDEPVCLIDLLATCADILQEKLPDHAGEDSVSNLAAWRGEKLDHSLREATIHHSFDGSFSIRQGRWKLEMCPGSGGWSSPRPGQECAGLPAIQLYDLTADIGERRNVFAEHPDIVAKLKELLTDYVRHGRSTPGVPQRNFGDADWEELWWMRGGTDEPTQPQKCS
ncbi:MAG: Arylsulfatase [Verrucomicrobiae bacterium]|nr:Arylsulfatase [Verrucomicrobiae bacterium]